MNKVILFPIITLVSLAMILSPGMLSNKISHNNFSSQNPYEEVFTNHLEEME